MKKRVFLTGCICLAFSAFITGCGKTRPLSETVIEYEIEKAMGKIEPYINDLYTDEIGEPPDKEKEALFIQEYTGKWISLKELIVRTNSVWIVTKNGISFDEEAHDRILVYITVDNGSVSVETKQAE